MNNRRFNTIVKGALILFLIAEVYGKRLEKRDVDCTIKVNGDFRKTKPLLLSSTIGQPDFLYPLSFGNGQVDLHRGDTFAIACPDSTIRPETFGNVEYTSVTCVEGDEFYFEESGFNRPLKDILCKKAPNSEARKIPSPTNVLCASGTPFEIGFELQGNHNFYRVIDLCFDMTMTNTLYAHAKITAAIGSPQKSVPSPCFRNDKIFGRKKMSEAYEMKTQTKTLTAILGSEAAALRYISRIGGYYFGRGHLVAKTDFIYGIQQLATFYYANVVPMWHNINIGNWKVMEDNVRRIAALRGLDFDVWVGGHGILQLEDDTGNKHGIYLFKKGKELAIPVPKILFKVVYNYPTKTGVVLLTINNPYLQNPTAEDLICPDVCNRISYLTWKPKILAKGLSYCCEIDEFRKAYPNLPPFTTTGLLI